MAGIDERDSAVRPDVVAPPRRALRVPAGLLLPAALGLAFLVLPLVGLMVRAPWSTLPQRLTEPGVLTALRLSLQTATIATLFCVVSRRAPRVAAGAGRTFPAAASCGRW